MKKLLPSCPFDGISPIRSKILETSGSQTYITESFEIIEAMDMSKESRLKDAKVFNRTVNHKPLRQFNSDSKKSNLLRVLKYLLMKRCRYSFQLIKQYYLFTESQSSFEPLSRYNAIYVEEGVEALHAFISNQKQQNLVMGFEFIRLLAVHKKQRSPSRTRKMLPKIQNLVHITQRFRRQALWDAFHLWKFLSNMAKSKQFKPTETAAPSLSDSRKISTRSVGTLTAKHVQERQVQTPTLESQRESKQIIYIVKAYSTKTLAKSERLQPKKSKFIKVPLVSDNIQINQINLKKTKRARQKVYQNNHCHGVCSSCQYCDMFLKLKMIDKVDFKYRSERKECATERIRRI